MNRMEAYEYSGSHGEPSGQSILSGPRSDSSQNWFYGVNQHNMGSQQDLSMQFIGQQLHHLGPGQYMAPPDPYHPGYQSFAVPLGHYGIQQPAGQYIIRDTTTSLPCDNEYNGPKVQPLIACTILKRTISVLFILLDICLNWMQFASWVGSTELPNWVNILEVANSLNTNSVKSQCDGKSETLTTVYGLFAGIGTAFGLFRIVNMIGETIIEYQQQYPSENERRCRGFQILHGWVETVLTMICDDIPQMILLVCFSWFCTIDLTAMAKVLVWMVIKDVKNQIRFNTCKHIYQPCCNDPFKDCCKDCCEYECDLVPCCTKWYFRPCACNGEKQCCEFQSYDVCPEIKCFRDGKYCGEIDKDPKWAKNIYAKLEGLYSVMVWAIVGVTLYNSI